MFKARKMRRIVVYYLELVEKLLKDEPNNEKYAAQRVVLKNILEHFDEINKGKKRRS